MTPTNPRRWLRLTAAFLLGLGLALAAAPAFADSPTGSSDGESTLDSAEERLESVIADRGYAPGALYDLGNAYLRDGEPGLAILQYERARLLAPVDPAIAHNLALAREAAGVSAPPSSPLEQVAARWPARRWMLAGFLALALFVLGCLGLGVLRRGRGAVAGATVVSGLVAAACALALWVGTLGVHRAVVLESAVTARVSPFEEADPLFELHEGEILEATGSHEDHVHVVLPDGRTGWVPASALAPIVPGALRSS